MKIGRKVLISIILFLGMFLSISIASAEEETQIGVNDSSLYSYS